MVTLIAVGCYSKPPAPHNTATTSRPGAAEMDNAVRAFCSACHYFPEPASFPKSAWAHEVELGFDFYYRSRRTDLSPPPLQSVSDWYRQHAPEEIDIPPAGSDAAPLPLQFQRTVLASIPSSEGVAVAHIRLASGPDAGRQLLACDMRAGAVWRLAPGDEAATRIASIPNPCHIEPVDLDGDEVDDFVVADLGSFLPEDHERGAIWWLRSAGEKWECRPLVSGLARCSDARPLDFDRDGDADLVVAEFGWRETGRLLLLENRGLLNGVPQMQVHMVDDRHGVIHVPVADLNGDGWPDFVALISQEHETVEVLENRRDGTFRATRIFEARNPAFGSSGIELVDLDADGDLDVLYSNGDSLDSALPKPYHGVRWLENQGDSSYAAHELAAMPGAHRALAGDVDRDGDSDVVVVALLPGDVLQAYPPRTFASILWLEQTSPGRFVRHVVETDACTHATCELADWDQDGRLELLLGGFSRQTTGPGELVQYRLDRVDAPPAGAQ
jgi:hypothetical protein